MSRDGNSLVQRCGRELFRAKKNNDGTAGELVRTSVKQNGKEIYRKEATHADESTRWVRGGGRGTPLPSAEERAASNTHGAQRSGNNNSGGEKTRDKEARLLLTIGMEGHAWTAEEAVR